MTWNDELANMTEREQQVARWHARATVAGAAVLRRHRNVKVGGDHQNPGKYGMYFFDDDGQCIRSIGGFNSIGQADEAVEFVIAETVIEEALQALDEEEGT